MRFAMSTTSPVRPERAAGVAVVVVGAGLAGIAALVQQHDDRLARPAAAAPAAYLLAVATSSRNVRPCTPAAVTMSGVPFSVIPMKPIFAPFNVLDHVRREQRLAGVGADRRWPTRNGKSAPAEGALAAGAAVGCLVPSALWRQPPFCIRSSSAEPSSNSWLPTLVTSRPRAFIASMVGSSWNAPDSSGLAPIRSPAATVSEWSCPARAWARWVARYSTPPHGQRRGRPVGVAAGSPSRRSRSAARGCRGSR